MQSIKPKYRGATRLAFGGYFCIRVLVCSFLHFGSHSLVRPGRQLTVIQLWRPAPPLCAAQTKSLTLFSLQLLPTLGRYKHLRRKHHRGILSSSFLYFFFFVTLNLMQLKINGKNNNNKNSPKFNETTFWNPLKVN